MTAIDPLIIEAFTYLGLGLCLVAFRVYCQSRNGFHNLQADDYIMIVVMVPYIAEACLAYTVPMQYHGLANNAMTDEERETLSPHSEEYRMRVGGSKNQIVGWSVYTTVVWMIKLSMCSFYTRLTTGLSNYKTRIYFGYALIGFSYLACMISILFSCRPMHKLWQINPNPGNICQPAVNRVNVYISMICDLVTDLYLFLLPLPLVWGAQIPKLKKISLMVLFSGGIFIIISGILRCSLILRDDKEGPRAGATWAVRESFVAVVMTNLPMTWGFIRQKLRPYFGSLISRDSRAKSQPEGGGGGGYQLDYGTGQSLRDKSSRGTILTHMTNNNARSEVYANSSPESSEDILGRAAPIGGIRKDIEVIVSTSEAQEGEGEDGFGSRKMREHV